METGTCTSNFSSGDTVGPIYTMRAVSAGHPPGQRLTFEDGLEVGVDGPRQHAGHAELVDVEAGRVAVVEDLGVPEAVDGEAEEGILALEPREQQLE